MARGAPAPPATRLPPRPARGGQGRAIGRYNDNRRRRWPGWDSAAGRPPSSPAPIARGRRQARLGPPGGPDPHRLNVDELFDPVRTQLATVAAAFDAAKGQARV